MNFFKTLLEKHKDKILIFREKSFRYREEFVGLLLACLSLLVLSLLAEREITFWSFRYLEWSADLQTSEFAFPGPGHKPLWPAWLANLFWNGEAVSNGVKIIALLSGTLTVWSTYHLARLVGDWKLGAISVAILMTNADFLAVATQPSPSVFLVATSTFSALALLRARTKALWILPAFIGLTALLLTHIVGWLMLLPAGFLFLSDGRSAIEKGHVKVAQLSLGMLLVPLAVLTAIFIVPAFRVSLEAFADWLAGPLRVGLESSLFAGTQYGPKRVPFWYGLWMWVIRSQPLIVFFGFISAILWMPFSDRIRGFCALSPRSSKEADPHEAMRANWIYLLWFFALPTIAGGPYLGEMKLLPLVTPFSSIFAAWSFWWLAKNIITHLKKQQKKVKIGVALASMIIFASFTRETLKVAPYFEAYFSPLIGRTEGAVLRGYSRSSHAPIRTEALLRAIEKTPQPKIAILSSNWEYYPVLQSFIENGYLPAETTFTTPNQANIFVLVLDDNLPELYDNMGDFMRLMRDPEMEQFATFADNVPLIFVLAESN